VVEIRRLKSGSKYHPTLMINFIGLPSQSQEVEYSFSGFIPTNEQTNKVKDKKSCGKTHAT